VLKEPVSYFVRRENERTTTTRLLFIWAWVERLGNQANRNKKKVGNKRIGKHNQPAPFRDGRRLTSYPDARVVPKQPNNTKISS
jgi:hypothetical protein